MRKTISIIVGILSVPIIGLLGGYLTDQIYNTFVDFRTLIIMGVIAIIVVVLLVIFAKLPRFIAGAIVIGVLISPYMQFLVGKIDIFVTDPPNLRSSISVPEIRVQMGGLDLINEAKETVNVLPPSSVHTLYPGKNIVNLGKLNIPPGNYAGGHLGEQKVEIDIYIDLDQEVELAIIDLKKEFAPELARIGELQDIPEEYRSQIPTEETMRERIRTEMDKVISRDLIAPYLPDFVQIKEFTKTDNKIKIVLSATMPGIDLPIPAFPYPTGTGGPDITLDITLNEIGLPTGIVPIINLPPGAPAINIPNVTPNINVELPTNFGIPSSAIAEIHAQIDAGIQQAEAVKAQMEKK